MPPRPLRAPSTSIRGPRPQSITQSDIASSASSSSMSSSSPPLSDITSLASLDSIDATSLPEDNITPLPESSLCSHAIPKFRRRANSIRLSLQPKGPRTRRSPEDYLRFPQPPNSAPLYPSHSDHSGPKCHERSISTSSNESSRSLPVDRTHDPPYGYQRMFSQDYQDEDPSLSWMLQTIDWDVIDDSLLSFSPNENTPDPSPPKSI